MAREKYAVPIVRIDRNIMGVGRIKQLMERRIIQRGRMAHICVSKKRPSPFYVLACRLIGAKPLPEPMLGCC